MNPLKNRTHYIIFGGMLAFLLSACASQKNGNLLFIKEQGSFAVGSTVIKNEGTFDPIKRTPEGQTFHGDHAYITYQIPISDLNNVEIADLLSK